jgi:nucleotide-binding universal stress UspA family protein
MYHSILVPLDGSTFGEHALPLALSLARRSGARLQLVHVHCPAAVVSPEGATLYFDDFEAELKGSARAYLDGVVQRLHTISNSRVPLELEPVLLEGYVADALHARAAAGADLVVMTTHGRGPLGRFWLGSVADELVRHSPAPVLLVRPDEARPDLNRDPPLPHVLVPLDGTPLAEQILGPAADLASLVGADITLLRVIKPVLPSVPLQGGSLGGRAEELIARVEVIHAQLRQDAQEYLDKMAQPLRGRSLLVQTRVVVADHPATAILREAAELRGGAVALATHGRRGLSRLFLGSVADKVVRASPVPVLLLRPTDT